ncbi:MAG: haloacid dehalogenase type II [Actinobacteria bacterium]|nr:haloacid dehalogenase type II [Actinomycetota bacterium]
MIQLVILDVNGTLFSLDAVADGLADVGLPGQLDVWFARILRDGFATAAAGTFVAFPDLARHHLTVLLDESGSEPTDERIDHVIGGFDEVAPHPDVEPGLRRLTDAGVTITTMTNGTVEITRDFLHRENLERFVEDTYDVEMAGRWKPAPEPYRYVLGQHEVEPGNAALIAVHPWDIHGAATAGLLTGWVNRSSARYPDPLARPAVEADSFETVVDRLLAIE